VSELLPTEPVDIAEELEACGDALSLRAARYISIKRTTEDGLRKQLRHATRPMSEREPPHCSTCACGALDVPARHECVFRRTGGPVETHCVLCGAPSRISKP
jgi:hypothetical protein